MHSHSIIAIHQSCVRYITALFNLGIILLYAMLSYTLTAYLGASLYLSLMVIAKAEGLGDAWNGGKPET